MESAENSLTYFLSMIEQGVYKVVDGELYNRRGKRLGTIHRQGYKVYAASQYRVYAHRLLFAYYYGIDELARHESVNHLDCDKLNNRAENLEGCSLRENTKHQWANGLMAVGESRHSAKLTEKDVRAIKKMLQESDISMQDIRKMYGVSYSTIYNIKTGKNWRHVI